MHIFVVNFLRYAGTENYYKVYIKYSLSGEICTFKQESAGKTRHVNQAIACKCNFNTAAEN